MELIIAVVIFGGLLAIALAGLAYSNRQARLNDASRNAGGATVHPHDQHRAIRTGLAASQQDRL